MNSYFNKKDLRINNLSLLMCSGVYNIATIKKFIGLVAKMGYTQIYLEISANISIEEYPYYNYMLPKYSHDELREIDKYCLENNIELIPSIQSLGHFFQLSKHAVFNNITDVPGILLADEPQTYNFIDAILKTVSKIFTSKRINLGLDECGGLGSGRYKEIHGWHSEAEIFFSHTLKVFDLAKKYGLLCEMWGDMIAPYCGSDNPHYKNFLKNLPEDLKIHNWYYEISTEDAADKMFSKFKDFRNMGFASVAVNFRGIVPSNRFSIKQYRLYLDMCIKHNYDSFMVTTWNDYCNDASIYNILPSLYMASVIAHGKENECNSKDYFKSLTGVAFDDYIKIDNANLPETDFSRGNKSRYLFYNDILIGNFDCFVEEGYNDLYKKTVLELEKVNFGGYQYVFDTIICICNILSYKAELGKKIRKAYTENNVRQLKVCLEHLDIIINLMDNYITLFERQWLNERKTYNMEIQCIRYGGLKQRLIFAKKLLNAYLNGEVDKISELEETQYRYCGDGWNGIDSNYKDEGTFSYLQSVSYADL